MRLIIAEKHSVGQAIAQAVGGHMEKHDGYVQVGDDLVTWAQGHLVDLAAPDEYKNHDWGKWSLDTLPIDPTPDWQWKVSRDKGADRQYKVVAGLMRRGDVDMLVDACDPDREGEAIFRRIVTHVGVSKPMRRLWVASLEEDAIRDALASMKDETEYRGLADSAMIRAKADWLIGMNASRAYSLVYNARFTVGRVQTPTLAMIVDRDRQIAGHVARPYWKVVAPMGGWKLSGERLDKREDAETLLRIVNSDDFVFSIFKADRKQQHDAPPRLYDLTGLQKDMSRLHGLTAARTLTALQSLYEKKLATYPRTDSQYITHDDLDTLRGLTEGDRLVTGFIEPDAKPERPHLELTVNDAKVAGHTAVLPTVQADKAALDELGDDERLVLVRVARRMWEAVGDDYVHDVTNVVANIDPHWCEKHPDEGRLLSEGECRFTSRSDQPVSLGWHAIEHDGPQEDQDDNDETAGNIIPANLVTGVSIAPVPQCGATLSEGKTNPPKPFSEATLLAAMEHASRWVEDKDLKGRIGRRRIPLGRHRHPGHARRRDREADPHRIRGPQGQAAALHGPGPFPDRRGRPEAQGRGIDRRHGTTPLGGRTRTGGRLAGRNGVPRPRRAHTGRRADHRPAGPCAGEDAEHGIVRRLPALRQARRQNGQGVPMLHQPARETIRRYMEDHGGMRLARLDDRGRQDHHRHDHARPARRPEGQSQGLHLEEGQRVRRRDPHRQGQGHRIRLQRQQGKEKEMTEFTYATGETGIVVNRLVTELTLVEPSHP